MMRTKVVAILLAIVMLLCVPTFCAAAENGSCNVTVTINGSGTVTLDEIEYDDTIRTSVTQGDSVTLTATADEDNEFLFWVNKERADESYKIVSTEPTFTFYAATDSAKYEAVFDEDETITAAKGKHTIFYLTSGDNILCRLSNVNIGDTSYYSSIPTSKVYVSGRTFNGWQYTAEEVASMEGRVIVRPVYLNETSFVIKSTIDGVTTTRPALYLSDLLIEAPQTLNGEDFSYWRAAPKDLNSDPEIASFYANYRFVVTGDVDIEAVYGEPYPDDNPGVACRISGDLPNKDAETLAIFAEHSVTADFTVIRHGLIFTKDQQIGNFDDQFRIGLSPSIIVGTAKDTAQFGSYRANMTKWSPYEENGDTLYPRVFARAYVVVKDGNGVTSTVYSTIYCVDYNYDSGSGGGTNYDDPFG